MTTAIELKNPIVPAEVFKTFQSQIDGFKEINEKTVFDYEDKKGNKEARSHVANLRKAKTPIKLVHKEAKAEALKLGRELDTYKNELISQIEDMINVHTEPLNRIEDAEKSRIEEEERIKQITIEHEEALQMHGLFKREEEMKRQQAEMDAKQAEFDRIEKEQKLEKERIEREDKIREDAAAQAKRDAENQRLEAEQKLEEEKNRRLREAELAEKKRLAYIQDEKELKERVRKSAEKEKQDAIDELKREQEEKERLEKERIQKEYEDKMKREAEEAKKAANKAHRKRINNAIVARMVECGADEKSAKKIISWTVKGLINNMAINY